MNRDGLGLPSPLAVTPAEAEASLRARLEQAERACEELRERVRRYERQRVEVRRRIERLLARLGVSEPDIG